ncbi:hypothetical protein GCM10007242_45370 [Pigmentiphaga litoralis]|uniref:DUF6148 family protein n=1 Tax=Pigmentiphaga litoralis TaxID=516702 RepID=UPI00167994A4|nr:DUF6148 family protein [Pigmentiphaga litoralis]GGX33189.1 hypothetical protein GCM10007242_45370 [Pigmentiphaga litoralis]
MAGITLEIANQRLLEYLEAEARVLSGQSYTIETAGGKRQLTRANLAEIAQGIAVWDARVKNLEANANGRTRRVTMIAKGL